MNTAFGPDSSTGRSVNESKKIFKIKKIKRIEHSLLGFWNSQSVIFLELLDCNRAVKVDVCTKRLQKLADALRGKRRECLEVALLHGNARPHTERLTRDFQRRLASWTIVPYPPNSLGMAPSDYLLPLQSPQAASVRKKTPIITAIKEMRFPVF